MLALVSFFCHFSGFVVVGCIGLLKVEEVEYVDSGRVLVILVASVAVACIGPLKVKEVEYVDSGRVLVILLASVAVACIGPLKVEEVEYVDSGKVLVMFMQSSLNGGFRRWGRPYIYIEREREIDIWIYGCMDMCIYLCMRS